MKLTHKDHWEQGFAALCKFRGRKSHCCPPQRHLEGKYTLGSWVIIQRYRKDHLSVERKIRLDRIGFVWDWRDFAWERGFAALLKFKRREGHCRVPKQHREGHYKLGSWVSVQRRKKNVMPPKRQ
jgi:Helicase associated domain